MTTTEEVQKHGFTWEKEILQNVYGATAEEMQGIPYTNKSDLPGALNRLTPGCDISVKTSGNLNAVCMGDALRVFDAAAAESPLHMTAIHYIQNDETKTKKVLHITEVDLTASSAEMFGTITRAQLEELDRAVKLVPQKRSPTPEERAHMYAIRDAIQANSGAMHLDIKCDKTQSRLQCSFNRFRAFLEAHPARVVARSDTHEFRGGSFTPEIVSGRRAFKKKIMTPPAPALPPAAVDLSPDSPPISTDSAVPPCL